MIGCGLISAAHGIAAGKSSRPVRFSSCSSRSLESAKAFSETYSCDAFFDDHKELLANQAIDGVVIAAPPDVHEEIIHDCIEAGVLNILCEKPLTLTAAEARRVEKAATGNGAVVLEAFMYRHHPQISKIKELLRAGDLGPVDQFYSAVNMLDASELEAEPLPDNWRRDTSSGGGVMHDFLCYPVDAANNFIDAEPLRALARVFSSPTYDTPYRVFGLIEYDNGVIASVNASRLADFNQPLVLGCQNGSLSVPITYNPIGDSVITLRRSHGLIATNTEEVIVPVDPPVSKRLLDLQVFTTQLEHFADIIRTRIKPAISLQESIRNAAVRDALIESATIGGWANVS